MQMNDMILVSVDDHVIEPPHMFEGRMPAKFANRAPRVIRSSKGRDIWTLDGKPIPMIGMNAVAGRAKHEYGMEAASYDEMRSAAYDVHARIDDMNANGVLGALCFPSFPSFGGKMFFDMEDKDLALACIRAYNDWHVDEWCGTYPDRLIPLAVLPLWSPELSAAEVRRVHAKGTNTVSLPDNTTQAGFPSIHDESWEPLWKAIADTDMMITAHMGTGNAATHASDQTPIDAWILTMPISIAVAAADWMHMKIWEKYPNMRITLAEGGVGWVPYFLERADITHDRHHEWTRAEFGGRLPSEVFKKHFMTCFIEERFGVDILDYLNDDMVTWECDYPHADTTWPRSPEVLWEAVKDLPAERINKITHGNAMREYKFDAFSRRPRERCTVGALRALAQGVDTEPKDMGGVTPGEDGRRVTSGDVERMLRESMSELA
ncbi:amidohydrolase [Sandaracinobacter neustonicus]|uniref:Amidohydrolase n=1 Tax=Sandaracinobacter neustonicus TaxID=1715348 RepID=A0A501XLT9_9SPHN|nr:amidohydrolase family protein [Sandaracinobacter neustonicus]TPE61550.1 amidohydrolase [Sandaracinobacter neustonicus]